MSTNFLAAKVAHGITARMPNRLAELTSSYHPMGIRKLGVVFCKTGFPRLVPGNSISNVTPNSAVPNHMMLPQMPDVTHCMSRPRQTQRLRMTVQDWVAQVCSMRVPWFGSNSLRVKACGHGYLTACCETHRSKRISADLNGPQLLSILVITSMSISNT